MGDLNASLPTPRPVMMRPMFGANGKAMPATCARFMSRGAFDSGIAARIGTGNIFYPVHGTRQISKADMVRNTALTKIEVDPETFKVYVVGILATVPPAKELPLAQLYWFS